jgi:hypothetical protein
MWWIGSREDIDAVKGLYCHLSGAVVSRLSAWF